MSEEDDGRLYKIARRIAPIALGVRTCPNCGRERALDSFSKIRRGKRGWSWICEVCFGNRKPPRKAK